MSRTDPIADALTNLKNHEDAAKAEVALRPASRLLKEILRIMQDKGYIGGFEEIGDTRGGTIKVKLVGRINQAKAIKPRYAVKKDEFEKFEKKYLPAYDVGTIIVSTPKGVLTHIEAKEKNLGGRLLAYVY
ncbi:MAG: 30S ribosomal protein S8 [Candidatus Diapherotrites archaeon]|uniref:Small ribosomal subunit protein uS8 n=1 Tax=Candidatus Iainarchaeum sp. TaxID=3101447 RepID=A0A8T3YM45_9ARCH|nr:30S ribosomal protein S8 [Candidatus Diapherotrites archaeon]